MGFAAALFLVQVYPAVRAKSPAIAAANHFHGKRQIHLFGEHIGEEQAVTLEKRNLRIIQIQTEFLIPADRRHGAVEQVEILADFLDHGLQAPGANQFQPRVERAIDPDLIVDKLRRCANIQRLDLVKIAGMEIERSRSVILPDANLPRGEFVYVEKHEKSQGKEVKSHYKMRSCNVQATARKAFL